MMGGVDFIFVTFDFYVGGKAVRGGRQAYRRGPDPALSLTDNPLRAPLGRPHGRPHGFLYECARVSVPPSLSRLSGYRLFFLLNSMRYASRSVRIIYRRDATRLSPRKSKTARPEPIREMRRRASLSISLSKTINYSPVFLPSVFLYFDFRLKDFALERNGNWITGAKKSDYSFCFRDGPFEFAFYFSGDLNNC